MAAIWQLMTANWSSYDGNMAWLESVARAHVDGRDGELASLQIQPLFAQAIPQ